MIVTVAGIGSSGNAGDGGPATGAQLSIVLGVAVDTAGSFYIADSNRIRKVTGGAISTIAGTLVTGFSGDGGAASKAQFDQDSAVFVDAAGNLYIADTGTTKSAK